MLSFSVLSGGSKGNCTLVKAAGKTILFDAGLSYRELVKRLDSIGEICPDGLCSISALFISHEHSDHTKGIGVIHRKTGCPVYLTAGTLASLPSNIGAVSDYRVISRSETIDLEGVRVRSFAVNHDASEPVGYTLEFNGIKFGLATDLGCPTNILRTRLEGCHALVIESNHDRRMLMTGPYPPELKTRVNGNRGHLSNETCGRLLEEIVCGHTSHVVLTHLSEENNTSVLALSAARQALARAFRGARSGPADISLQVASQSQATPMAEVDGTRRPGSEPATMSLPFTSVLERSGVSE